MQLYAVVDLLTVLVVAASYNILVGTDAHTDAHYTHTRTSTHTYRRTPHNVNDRYPFNFHKYREKENDQHNLQQLVAGSSDALLALADRKASLHELCSSI